MEFLRERVPEDSLDDEIKQILKTHGKTSFVIPNKKLKMKKVPLTPKNFDYFKLLKFIPSKVLDINFRFYETNSTSDFVNSVKNLNTLIQIIKDRNLSNIYLDISFLCYKDGLVELYEKAISCCSQISSFFSWEVFEKFKKSLTTSDIEKLRGLIFDSPAKQDITFTTSIEESDEYCLYHKVIINNRNKRKAAIIFDRLFA